MSWAGLHAAPPISPPSPISPGPPAPSNGPIASGAAQETQVHVYTPAGHPGQQGGSGQLGPKSAISKENGIGLTFL